MKSILATCALLTLSLSSIAQIAHDVEIYAEAGEKFTVTMNGRVLNEEPAARVEVRNIEYDFVHLILNFEDDGIENIDKKYFQIGNVGSDQTETDKPVIVTYKVKEKKGKYKLKFVSRFNKKVQQNTVIINQQGTTESNGVTLTNGKIVINW